MVLKTNTAINSLLACIAASILCACSQANTVDSHVGQDTPNTQIASEAPMKSGTHVVEDPDPKPSHASKLATATTFEAVGLTPRSYCEQSDQSKCHIDFLPKAAGDEPGHIESSNPYQLVREDSAFGADIVYQGSLLFPANLDPQFIAYYAPKYVLSDDLDIEDFREPSTSGDAWYETALLPVTWRQTGCSGIMGVSMYRGTEHARDSFFFVDGSDETPIQTFSSSQKISVELTVSGYLISTEYEETVALTIALDDEGRCVAKVQSDK